MSWSECPKCHVLLNNWYATHRCEFPKYTSTGTTWDRKPGEHVCVCEICKKAMDK